MCFEQGAIEISDELHIILDVSTVPTSQHVHVWYIYISFVYPLVLGYFRRNFSIGSKNSFKCHEFVFIIITFANLELRTAFPALPITLGVALGTTNDRK